MNEEIIKIIEEKLRYNFVDKKLLIRAFSHSSFSNQFIDVDSYELLEFVGDSVLNVVVTLHLFEKYPSMDQGFLSKTRSILIANKNISKAIDNLDLIQYLRTSDAVIEVSDKLKADLYESIVGAIYLDSNDLSSVAGFITNSLDASLCVKYTNKNVTDSKSTLFEYAAKKGQHIKFVTNILESETPTFQSTVYYNNIIYGKGVGASKKQAEQVAASCALKKLHN